MMKSPAEGVKRIHFEAAAKYALRGISKGSIHETAAAFLQIVKYYSQDEALDWLWNQVLSQISLDEAEFAVERLDLYAAKLRVGL